ncbi:MAG: hypothetical protein JWP76_5820, partial [Dactylosporangium sp.]|nr:hypothetical protein [Dactylosporangium sp.]
GAVGCSGVVAVGGVGLGAVGCTGAIGVVVGVVGLGVVGLGVVGLDDDGDGLGDSDGDGLDDDGDGLGDGLGDVRDGDGVSVGGSSVGGSGATTTVVRLTCCVTLTFEATCKDTLTFIGTAAIGNSSQVSKVAPGGTTRARPGWVEHRLDRQVILCPPTVSAFTRGSLKSAQLNGRGLPLMFWYSIIVIVCPVWSTWMDFIRTTQISFR